MCLTTDWAQGGAGCHGTSRSEGRGWVALHLLLSSSSNRYSSGPHRSGGSLVSAEWSESEDKLQARCGSKPVAWCLIKNKTKKLQHLLVPVQVCILNHGCTGRVSFLPRFSLRLRFMSACCALCLSCTRGHRRMGDPISGAFRLPALGRQGEPFGGSALGQPRWE